MDDGLCLRALLSVCIYVGHNVVTYYFFSFLSHIEVDVGCVSFKFGYLLICDVES